MVEQLVVPNLCQIWKNMILFQRTSFRTSKITHSTQTG